MRLRLGLAALALTAAVVAVLVSIFLVRNALADGDPASDYLITQQTFLPLSENVSLSLEGEFTRLVDDAKAKGFPLKVAVIAEPTDLGAVPSLFGTPQRYASFLGQEDFYFWKQELLVVMPQGYGLYKAHGLPAADRKVIARLRPPKTADADGLVLAAERAVRALAARRGLTLSSASSSGDSAWRDRLEIVAGVLVLAALALVVRATVHRR
jgi:hypothetical protein